MLLKGAFSVSKDELLLGLITELRRGTLTLAVLGCLSGPRYGYSLLQEMEDKGVRVEANTLYPLLRRLETQGLLESVWKTDAAKPRKYYQITALGADILEALKNHWTNTVDSVNTLLGGNESET